MSALLFSLSPLAGESDSAKLSGERGAKICFARGCASLILSQLRLSSFVAKASYPSPVKGEGLVGVEVCP